MRQTNTNQDCERISWEWNSQLTSTSKIDCIQHATFSIEITQLICRFDRKSTRVKISSTTVPNKKQSLTSADSSAASQSNVVTCFMQLNRDKKQL